MLVITFIVHQLQQLGMVVVVMGCALFGTIGIIKLIKTLFHIDNLPPDLFNRKPGNKTDDNVTSK